VDREPLEVVVGVLMDPQGRVLINQRLPGTHLAGFWEFPGGKLNPGEDRCAGLRRELAEELGVTVLAAEPLLTLRHDYPDKPVRLDVWRVTRYAGEPTSAEGQPLRWLAPAALSEAGLLPADAPIVETLLAQA
jgi:8-oxo-dGTP diphosphatase